MYASSKEQRLKRKKLLTRIAKLNKEWRVSFEVKPTSYKAKQSSVFHMSAKGQAGKPGDQTPAVWFHKKEGVLVEAFVNGNKSFLKTFDSLPKIGEWIKIDISQEKAGSQFIYTISINGEEKFSEENTKAAEFSNVQVYASSPNFIGQKGTIRNVTIENRVDGKKSKSYLEF